MADLEGRNEIQICLRNLGGVFGDEHIFLSQGAGRDVIVERDIDRTGEAFFHCPSNVEGGIFEEADEAALEAEETGGANHRGLHELVELASGSEFERNLEDFVEFVGLGTRHSVQLGIGHGYRAKAGEGRDQRLVFLRERLRGTGINQNRAVRA